MSEYKVIVEFPNVTGLPEYLDSPEKLQKVVEEEFNKILKEVEELLGFRDPQYTEFIIQFGGNRPQIIKFKTPQVTISLTEESLSLINYHYYNWQFQLAHELVHCLNPVACELGTFLEEGIASDFSERYVKYSFQYPYNTNYFPAMIAFRMLGDNRYDIIRTLRNNPNSTNKSISYITKYDLNAEIKYPVSTTNTDVIQHIEKYLANKFNVDCKNTDNIPT